MVLRMDRIFLHNLRFTRMHLSCYGWAIAWCSGLLLGWLVSYSHPYSKEFLVDSVVTEQPFFHAVFLTLIFPFVLTVFAVSLFGRGVLYPIIAMKGFAYAYCVFGTVLAFGSAGWLVCLLLLFPMHGLSPVLLWFWQRCGKSGCCLLHDFLVCTALTAAIGILYICWISPLLAASIF